MKHVETEKFIYRLLILLTCIWFLISLGRLGFNYFRTFTLEKKWMGYTDQQKRRELYGDIYVVLQYINMYFPSENNMLLISRDGKEYFISRYILYPRKIYWDKLDKNMKRDMNKYSLIINFHPQETKISFSKDFFAQLEKNKKILKILENNKLIATIYK